MSGPHHASRPCPACSEHVALRGTDEELAARTAAEPRPVRTN